jgi:hypothetical protein
MVCIFTQSEFDLEIKPIFNQIFLYDNVLREPFSPKIDERIIIYPCYSWIESPLIDNIISVAKDFGDTGCYFSQLPVSTSFLPYSAEIYAKIPNEPPKNLPMTAYFSLDYFQEFYTSKEEKYGDIRANFEVNICPPEFAIYSATGKWGLMVSEEHLGVLGGSPEFIEEIKVKTPNLEYQVYEFLDYLYGLIKIANIDPPEVTCNQWLLPLLNHVYGKEKTSEILTFFRKNYINGVK